MEKGPGEVFRVKGGPIREAGVVRLSHKVLKGNDFTLPNSLRPTFCPTRDQQPQHPASQLEGTPLTQNEA